MRLTFKDEALKRLKRIGAADSNKVQRKIEFLKENPRAGKQLHGAYEGKYSLRAGPLRIIYTFTPDTQIIKIFTIDYRGDVYKG